MAATPHQSPDGDSFSCRRRPPFVCFADISPAPGGITSRRSLCPSLIRASLTPTNQNLMRRIRRGRCPHRPEHVQCNGRMKGIRPYDEMWLFYFQTPLQIKIYSQDEILSIRCREWIYPFRANYSFNVNHGTDESVPYAVMC